MERAAARSEILGFLRRRGLALHATELPDRFSVEGPATWGFVVSPIVTLPLEALAGYLRGLERDASYAADSAAEAVSLAQVHVLETLDAVDGAGRNTVREVGVRQRPDGTAEFFVERVVVEPPPVSDGENEWVADRP